MYKTRLSLWMAPRWEGGWIWYPFLIYMIIYVLIWYLIWWPSWTRDKCYWYMMITRYEHDDMFLRALLIEDTEPNLPPYLNFKAVELRWRATRVEGTLENRLSPFLLPVGLEMLLPYLHRVGDFSPLSGLYKVYPGWHHTHKLGFLGISLLIWPTGWECAWGV